MSGNGEPERPRRGLVYRATAPDGRDVRSVTWTMYLSTIIFLCGVIGSVAAWKGGRELAYLEIKQMVDTGDAAVRNELYRYVSLTDGANAREHQAFGNSVDAWGRQIDGLRESLGYVLVRVEKVEDDARLARRRSGGR